MASNPQHEPTMEEILASIRKIISEDSGESEVRADAPAHLAAPETDVLELTRDDVVEEATARFAAPEVESHEPVVVMPLAGSARQESEVAFQPVEESHVSPAINAAVNNDARSEANEGFFSESSRKALHETFSQLDTAHDEAPAAPSAAAPTPAPDGASVQAVFEHAVREKIAPLATDFLHSHIDEVVERMKPIIREWMDEHFPAILEGAVRNEVERAVRASAAAKSLRR